VQWLLLLPAIWWGCCWRDFYKQGACHVSYLLFDQSYFPLHRHCGMSAYRLLRGMLLEAMLHRNIVPAGVCEVSQRITPSGGQG
jgi:hypothetical protein